MKKIAIWMLIIFFTFISIIGSIGGLRRLRTAFYNAADGVSQISEETERDDDEILTKVAEIGSEAAPLII